MTDEALWRAYIQDVAPLIKNSLPVKPTAPPLLILPRFGHTLDLHGLSLSVAYASTIEFLTDVHARFRYATIITGLSGSIRHEFEHWLAGFPIQRVEPINGGGGFRIYFRKNR